MRNFIEEFLPHLTKSNQFKMIAKKGNQDIRNVVICGLGGSGIGGTIVAQLLEQECRLPIIVCKSYFLPAFVNEHTLVIVSSYSGNTEETIQSMDEALNKKAAIFCISSGGKIIDKAIKLGLNYIQIPSGVPPRAAFGLSFPQLLRVFHFYDLINTDYRNLIEKSIDLLQASQNEIIREAKEIAEKLYKKTPIIYSEASYEGIAIRFRQQLNENAKILCWHHAIPEMNHNELVGWANKNEELAVIIFRNSSDYERVQTRIEINKQIISKYTPNIIEIYSKGDSMLEKVLYFIHIGDWISLFLSEKNGVDPVEVRVIDFLKGELNKS
jgi:glucose/mannose-6-phosphate isomerase